MPVALVVDTTAGDCSGLDVRVDGVVAPYAIERATCGGPATTVWVSPTVAPEGTVTVTVSPGGEVPRPDEVFALYDDFRTGLDGWIVRGDVATNATGLRSTGRAAIHSIDAPVAADTTELVVWWDVQSGFDDDVEVGVGLVDDAPSLYEADRTWTGVTFTAWTEQQALAADERGTTCSATVPYLPAPTFSWQSGDNRALQRTTFRWSTGSAALTSPRANLTEPLACEPGRAQPALLVLDIRDSGDNPTQRVAEVFVRALADPPPAVTDGACPEPPGHSGPSPEGTGHTGGAAHSGHPGGPHSGGPAPDSAAVKADPGCGCSSPGSGSPWVVVVAAALALVRRGTTGPLRRSPWA